MMRLRDVGKWGMISCCIFHRDNLHKQYGLIENWVFVNVRYVITWCDRCGVSYSRYQPCKWFARENPCVYTVDFKSNFLTRATAAIFEPLQRMWDAVSSSLVHTCPAPPQQELMAVLGRIGAVDVWEQRRCTTCGKVSHWRRDGPNEPFRPWSHPLGGPVCADLSKDDLRSVSV